MRAAGRADQDRIVVEEIFAGEFARAALPGMLALIRRWRPDVVVRETLEFASLLACDALDVPDVHVTCFLRGRFDGDYGLTEAFARLRREFDLPRNDGDPWTSRT